MERLRPANVHRQSRFQYLILMFIFFAFSSPVRSEEFAAGAEWRQEKGQRILSISLMDLIGNKRKNLIQSGFTTFTHLIISFGAGERKSRIQIECSVKYDTWNERYHLLRVGSTNEQKVVNTLEAYGRECLSFDIVDAEIINLLVNSESVIAELAMQQLSLQQAEKIRNWLVTQQSGIMQNLFSHMLGDMTLTDNLVAKIKLPRAQTGKN